MKKFLLLFFMLSFLSAEILEINDFKSELYSKATNQLQKVEASLIFEGRDVKENRYKIIDALNIVIGSFFFEDLMTSKGKERFKTLLIKYLEKKYGIDIDEILIVKLIRSENIKIKELIKELKKEGCCYKK